jgi:hypothetical protein
MVGLQIEQDGSIGMSSSKGKIIHAPSREASGQWALLFGSSQQGISADWHG